MLGVVAIFELAAALLFGLGAHFRPKNPYLSNMLFGGAFSLAILPGLAWLAILLSRNGSP